MQKTRACPECGHPLIEDEVMQLARTNMTPTELKLLNELYKRRGEVVAHSILLTNVWGKECVNRPEYLHVYIPRLRQKLKNASPDFSRIISFPGVGYCLSTMHMTDHVSQPTA